MSSKNASIVSYITWIGFVIALVMGDTNDPYLKHHLNQSLILAIIGTVCSIIGGIFAAIPVIRVLAAIVFGLIGLVVFICWLMGIISAATGSTKPIPVIGEIKIFN